MSRSLRRSTELQGLVSQLTPQEKSALRNLLEQYHSQEQPWPSSKRRMADLPPSSLSKGNAWMEDPNNPMFICYRGPPAATPEVPLFLLEPSFMTFKSHVNGTCRLESNDMKFAERLCSSLVAGFKYEATEMALNINKLLHDFLQASVRPGLFYTGDGSLVRPDSVVEGSSIIIEFKLNMAEALFQGLQYFRHCFSPPNTYGRSHGLLVLLTGCYLQAFAVLKHDPSGGHARILAEPLCDAICCFGPSGEVLPKVARFLSALKRWHTGYKPAEINCTRPYHLADFTAVHRYGQHLVYQPKDTNQIIKFTQNYSQDAHNQWACKGVAPTLFSVDEIGCGWKMVIMENLREEDGWFRADKIASKYMQNTPTLHRLRECIINAINLGHSTGYVHGDIRMMNILIKEKTDGDFEVRFLDFEWAGLYGEVVYQVPLNGKIKWHPGVGYFNRIELEHNTWFVRNLDVIKAPEYN